MIDVDAVRAALYEMSGSGRAARISVAEYGTLRPRLGIRLDALRDYAQSLVTTHKHELTLETVVPLFDALYAGESIEETIIAGLMLARLPAIRQTLPLATFGVWLGQLAGWIEVDSTCQSTFTAKDLYARWDEWAAFLRALNRDENMAKRRASLVLLNRTVRESDDQRGIGLALELAASLAPERDKLITKAVSWTLREAAKLHSTAVGAFIDTHADTLHVSLVREVRTKLATGKKR